MDDILTKEQFVAKFQSLTEVELAMVATACGCFVCGHAILNKKFEDAYDHTIRVMAEQAKDLEHLFNFSAATHYVNQ